MRPGAKRAILFTAIIAATAVLVTVRQEYLTVPRIRVGPLRSSEPATPTMRFFAFGDSGTGGEAQLKVAAAMEERCREKGANAILMLGDNAYPAGFSSVEDPQWQTKVLDPYGSPCLAKLPIYAVLGNHDYKENPAAEIEYSLINSRWHMPNRFYSVTFGKLLKVVAVDTNVTDFCFKAAFCGLDFLMDEIVHQDTTWTMAMAHHPLASSSDHGFAYRGGVRGMILRPYLCDRIDLWVSGHSHHMEHRQPPGCRMELFVAGGGGGDLYQTIEHPDPDVRFVKTDFGFLELEVTQQQLTSRYLGEGGRVLYETHKTPVAPNSGA